MFLNDIEKVTWIVLLIIYECPKVMLFGVLGNFLANGFKYFDRTIMYVTGSKYIVLLRI